MPHLKLRVTPGSRKQEIAGWHGDALRVRVNAPPERGKANDAAVRLVASALDLPARQVTLERGATSRDKVLKIEGLSEEEMLRRLPGRASARRML
jgi:uncharacterized protein (TIGR00251 family)